MKRVALATLGCKLNQADTEAIRFAFERAGYESAPFTAEARADVFVVNTCTVTGAADHQCRQILRRAIALKSSNPGAIVVATGCYTQIDAAGLETMAPGIDLQVGNLDKNRIPELVAEYLRAGAAETERVVRDVFEETEFRALDMEGFAGRDRAFLRVQEGCDRRCSYCVVPLARGRERSAPLDVVVSQAERFVRNGFEEIVITGVHIGRYGRGLNEEVSLADLIIRLSDIDGLRRVRLGSIAPGEIKSELISALDFCKEKICDHFHISLQSGDNSILRAMRRGYTADEHKESVAALREIFPAAAIGADVIVGFPGESDENFAATRAALELTRPSHMHIFRYSPRAGTPAAEMPEQIPEDAKKARARELSELKIVLNDEFRRRHIGEIGEILFESRRDSVTGKLVGLTRNYIRAYADGPDELQGHVATATLVSLHAEGMLAEDLSQLV